MSAVPFCTATSIYTERGRIISSCPPEGPFTVETKQQETVDNDTALLCLLFRAR
jgi:hypothetical protein